MRGPSPLSTQCGFPAALSAVEAVGLRACSSLVHTKTYQNQDLLVSGAVSKSPRRLTNESVG